VTGDLALRRAAAAALDELVAGAASQGFVIGATSAFRSSDDQVRLQQQQAQSHESQTAPTRIAPPGASEHQLGTAVDLSSPSVAWEIVARFAETPEGKWLQEHAHEYGFALSYASGAEEVTGFAFEPWHYRFVGREEAAKWRASGRPLITYLRSRTS
jgi:D-alanyl-D-alanine carboxypeptidase